jgi:hypothetical protein
LFRRKTLLIEAQRQNAKLPDLVPAAIMMYYCKIEEDKLRRAMLCRSATYIDLFIGGSNGYKSWH